MISWLDGRLHRGTEPVLRADDHGVTTGDGVFETVLVRDGTPFALSRHLARLVESAGRLGLTVETATVREGVAALLATGPPPLARLRITVTGGASPLSSERGPGPPTVLVSLGAAPAWPHTAAVATAPWTRHPGAATAGAKTISYADNVVALQHARAHGADEAVFATTDGRLCEGTGSNVFLAVGGRLVTPTLRTGCLAGITRGLLLEWAAAEEEDVPLAALVGADEVALTSATRGVQPVRAVDGRQLAAAPGPLTSRARALFDERSRADPDP